MSNETNQNANNSENNTTNQPQELIMGKYKSQDDLIYAFKELKNSYDNISQNKNTFTVPSEYKTPDNFSLIDSKIIEPSKDKAQKRGYTQSQYENLLASNLEKQNKIKESAKSRNEKYGEKIELLSSFIHEELGLDESVIDKFDNESIDKLLQYREKSISTNTDIGSNGYSGKLSNEDAHTAYMNAENARKIGDMVGFEFHLNRYKEISNKLRG